MDQEVTAVDKVFSVHLLRERILEYVIHDKNRVLIPNVRSCRLVNKSWLRSTSRMLFNSGNPLFRFPLSKHECYASDQEPVQQFLRSIEEGRFLDERVPLFAITASPYYGPCKQKRSGLSKFLMNHNCNVVELTNQFAGSDKMSLDTSIKLPNLRKLTVFLTTGFSKNFHMKQLITFVQSVFAESEQVKSFRLVGGNLRGLDHPPLNDLKHLRFPASITELHLKCLLSGYMLEALVKNAMFNLKVLRFNVSKVPFKRGLISGILNNVRKTLQTLHVGECSWERDAGAEAPTTIKFPLMEKLQKFTVETKYLELESNSPSLPIQDSVPMLNEMNLILLPISTVEKWIERLPVNSLKSLTVSCVSIMFLGWNWHYDDSQHYLDFQIVKNISAGYPNLRELDINLCRSNMKNIKFIMTEMRNLRRLSIKVDYICALHQDLGSSARNAWTEFLTEISEKEILASDNFKLQDNLFILNLTDLHTLQLTTLYSSPKLQFPLINNAVNAVFHLAFFKMPNLRDLVLKGGFSATNQLAKKWREDGRAIETECWRWSDMEIN